jgi:hypothetical protein
MSTFALLDSQFAEENVVKPPRATRACKGPHRFDGTIINNKAVGYVPVTYEHQEFPRMLYHPEWGMKARPEAARFFVGAVTQEQMQNAMAAFNEADQRWARSNRTKLVQNAKEQERLVKKGWLEKPPLRKENPAFDLTSDEL